MDAGHLRTSRRISGAAGFAAVYLVAVLLGRRFVEPTVQLATIWPASGIAVGALVTTRTVGRRGIALTLFVANAVGNLLTDSGWWAALGFGAVNTAAAVAAAGVLVSRGSPSLEVIRRLWAVVAGAAVGAVVGGSLGAVMLDLVVGVDSPMVAGATWAAADFVSVVLFAPLVVAVRNPDPATRWDSALKRVAVGSVLFVATVALFLVEGEIDDPLLYLVVAGFMLGALLVGGRSLIVLLASTFLVVAELNHRGLGPFADGSSVRHVILLQAFVAVLTVSSLSVAAIYRRTRVLTLQLSQTINSSSSLVFQVDDDRVALAHATARRVFGSDIGGRPIDELLGEGLADRALASDVGVEIEVTKPSGDRLLLEVSADPLQTESGGGKVIIARDLSVRRAMEIERRSLLDIIDGIPDFVGFADPDWSIRYLSPGARQMTGLGGGPIDELGIGALAPTWAAERIRHEAVPHAIEHGVWRGESAYLGPEGEEIPVAQVVMAHYDDRGAVVRLSTVAHDLRDRVKAEREREQLIDNTIHDLYNTLSAVGGAAEMLEADVAASCVPDQRLTDIMSRGVEQLKDLISDLVAAKQSDGSDAEDREEVDLLALVRRVIALHIVNASRAGVALEVEGVPCRVVANRPQLHRAIENLVTNAIKYSPDGGTVSIVVAGVGSSAQVVVADQGIGIDESDLPDVFERRGRAASAHRAGIEGTGLGLAICKQVVEAHGGSIGVESNPGVGSTFRIRLPRIDAFEAEAEPVGATAVGQGT